MLPMRKDCTRPEKVIIVGAGPVGLAVALDWAGRGHDVLVLAADGPRDAA